MLAQRNNSHSSGHNESRTSRAWPRVLPCGLAIRIQPGRIATKHKAEEMIRVLKTFPKELFRVNNGPHVQLREWVPKRPVYDVILHHGLVQAKALHPCSYRAPNGASLRPNSPYQQHLVSRIFKGNDIIVYAIPRGTSLPDDLLLVHERSDHFSLQPARDMSIQGLNGRITDFLMRHATWRTKEQWLQDYPRATDFDHLPSPRAKS